MPAILGISGSPREQGSSTFLLQQALEAAAEAGARVLPTVFPNRLRFRGCRNCGGCERTGVCVERDELTPVYAWLREADIWLFASPIFFDNITGPLKTLFDRLHCLYQPPGSKLPGRRTAGFIISYEDKPRDDYLRYAGIYLSYLAWFSELAWTGRLEASGIKAPGDAAGRPELARQARELGRNLVARLAPAAGR